MLNIIIGIVSIFLALFCLYVIGVIAQSIVYLINYTSVPKEYKLKKIFDIQLGFFHGFIVILGMAVGFIIIVFFNKFGEWVISLI